MPFHASSYRIIRAAFGDGPIGFERTGETSQHAIGHSVCLLFTKGKRPDRDALNKAAASLPYLSVTFDPCDQHQSAGSDRALDEVSGAASQPEDSCKPVWLEILRDGLTFDCVGLAPRQPSVLPEVRYLFDIEQDISLSNYETVMLTPGSHLQGGGTSLPVLRGLLGLARDLVQHFEEAKIVCWPPSQSAIGRRFFESTVTAWLDGGPFPALGLTAFADQSDGSIESVGLGHFIQQELRIEPELAADKLAATRLGLRLVNQLILVGGIGQSERIIAPDGSRLLLRPSRNGKFVRVSRE